MASDIEHGEADRVMRELGTIRAADLIERMGIAISRIADEIEDEGDRAYLGSTNEVQVLRALAQEWRDVRYVIND